MKPYRPKSPIPPLVIIFGALIGFVVGVAGITSGDLPLMLISLGWILFGIFGGIVSNILLNR